MGKKRVVIVEDEPLVAVSIEKKLTRMGLDVIGSFESGKKAIPSVEQEPPDLILMDIKLAHGEDGIDVAKEIHKTLDIPIIFLTAFADHETITRAVSAEPFSYLVKPFSEWELKSNIEIVFYRYELERKLKESESRYRIISELSSDLAFSAKINPSGDVRVEWITDAVYTITGYTEDEIIAENVFDPFFLEKDRRRVGRIKEGILQGEPRSFEIQIIQKNGAVRWVRTKIRPEWSNTESRVVRVYGSVEDISELKRIEDVERAKEQNYKNLIKSMNDGVIIVDKRGIITFANDRICSMSGFNKYELVGEEYTIFLHEDEKPQISAEWEQIKNGNEEPFETRIQRKSGEIQHVLISPKVLHDIKGSFSGSFSIITNIERQKAKEFSLQRQREEKSVLYDHIFENTRIPMLKLDFSPVLELLDEKKRRRVKDFGAYLEKHQEFLIRLIDSVRIIQANPAALRLFRVDSLERLQEMFLLFVLPETFDFFRQWFKKLAAEEQYVKRETKLADAEGETVPIFIDLSIPPKQEGYRETLLTLTDLREGSGMPGTRKDAIGEAEDRYKTIFSALPEAAVVCDSNRNVLYVSKKALQLFGCTEEKMVMGKPILSWIDPTDHGRAIENIKRVFQGESIPNRYALVDQEHNRFVAEIVSSVAAEPDGKKKNMISFIRKIEE